MGTHLQQAPERQDLRCQRPHPLPGLHPLRVGALRERPPLRPRVGHRTPHRQHHLPHLLPHAHVRGLQLVPHPGGGSDAQPQLLHLALDLLLLPLHLLQLRPLLLRTLLLLRPLLLLLGGQRLLWTRLGVLLLLLLLLTRGSVLLVMRNLLCQRLLLLLHLPLP